MSGARAASALNTTTPLPVRRARRVLHAARRDAFTRRLRCRPEPQPNHGETDQPCRRLPGRNARERAATGKSARAAARRSTRQKATMRRNAPQSPATRKRLRNSGATNAHESGMRKMRITARNCSPISASTTARTSVRMLPRLPSSRPNTMQMQESDMQPTRTIAPPYAPPSANSVARTSSSTATASPGRITRLCWRARMGNAPSASANSPTRRSSITAI
jgi:hypothetical protein